MIKIIIATICVFIGLAINWLSELIDFGLESPKRKKRETRKERKAREEREREEARERKSQEIEEDRKKHFYELVWSANWCQNGKPIEIRNIPQLSFEQWLTFYNSTPTNWHFNWEEWNNRYCIFPNYKKGKVDIDIFWETPEDLDKFIQWQNNNYKAGDAAIFEEARNKQLAKLTKALREDMKQRHEQAQKEIEELEKQIIANMPAAKEEDPIQKYLREQREEKTKEFNNLSDLITYVCNKYPDYQYAESQRMLTGDGIVTTEITLVHKHKPGNLIRETYFYDEKTQTWQESSMR